MPALPIENVRTSARNCGLEEIYFNENSKVISFRGPASSRKNDTTRFNVYYTTGTVGTSLDHPRQGKTQLFRRNVDLQKLQKIFLDPRTHTGFGYQNKKISDTQRMRDVRILRDKDLNVAEEDQGEKDDDDEDEESAAKKQMAKLLAERNAIDEEIKEIQAILDEHERVRQEQRRREEEEQRRKVEEEKRERQRLAAKMEEQRKKRAEEQKLRLRRERGQYGCWQGLREQSSFNSNFRSDTTCVAIGGDRHLCLYECGGWGYSSGLPIYLHKKLHTRAKSHPSPTYIAMSNDDRYYIRFSNGKSEWVGPTAMGDCLNNNSRKVRSIAFGQTFEDYFVVFEDGWWNCSTCPEGLSSKLKARRHTADLDKVSLGPNGEWFLRAKNGRTWWGNVSETLTSKAREITNTGRNITDIQFGGTGTWFIRYK